LEFHRIVGMSPAPVLSVTRTGVAENIPVPSPSWPEEFLPQHLISPLKSRAHEWNCPAATSTAEEMPLTPTGTTVDVAEAFGSGGKKPKKFPLPSWPSKFSPQHLMVLLVSAAQEWAKPAATLEGVFMASTN
jgi:hypothetical protein